MRGVNDMGTAADISSFKYDSYVAMRIGIAFVVYLALMGICLVLNPNSSNPLLMTICAGASMVFTVTFCVICFDVFAKAKKITQDGSTANGTSETGSAASTDEPEEKKNEAFISGSLGNDAPGTSSKGGNAGLSGVNGGVNNGGSDGTARKERCIALGKKYGLTKREIEVFGLLLEGKNARDIENILYISRYTAKTHIGSVYRKTDVHSQQDLIDMFSQEGSHAE